MQLPVSGSWLSDSLCNGPLDAGEPCPLKAYLKVHGEAINAYHPCLKSLNNNLHFNKRKVYGEVEKVSYGSQFLVGELTAKVTHSIMHLFVGLPMSNRSKANSPVRMNAI